MAPRSRIALVSLLASLTASQATNPNLCPFGYIGCYSDGILQDEWTDSLDGPITMENCLDICYGQGYNYGGAQNGTRCWCADTVLNPNSQDADSACNLPCAGNSAELCGGKTDQTVYQLSPEAPSCEDGGSTTSSVPASTTSNVPVTSASSDASPTSTISTLSATSVAGPYPVTNSSMTMLLPPVGTGGISAMSSSSTAPVVGGSSSSLGASGASPGQSNTAAGTVTSGGVSGTGTAASTTSPTVAPPAPTVSGTTRACYAYQVIAAGSSCYSVQQQYGIDFNYFQSLNPSLNVACSNLQSGYAYCVHGVPAARVAGGSSTISTTKPAVVTVSTIAPGQTGSAAQAARHSYTSDGSICQYKTYTYNMGAVTVGMMSS